MVYYHSIFYSAKAIRATT